MENEKRGGKRNNSGRKPIPFEDKKHPIYLYVKSVDILKFGSKDKLIVSIERFIDSYEEGNSTQEARLPSKSVKFEKSEITATNNFPMFSDNQQSTERQKSAVEWVQEKREIADGDIEAYEKYISRLDKAFYLGLKTIKEIKFA